VSPALACWTDFRSDYLHGKLPVAPSALAPEGQVNLLRLKKNYDIRLFGLLHFLMIREAAQ
jgi:hypothetical protein